MNSRWLGFAAGLALLASLAVGQQSWTLPRTADGHPDFQGYWTNNNATPLERPRELAGREFLTDAEVAALRKKAAELFNGEGDAAFGDDVFRAALANVNGTRAGFKSVDGETGDYSSVWTVQRVWDNRTSLITDPRDGRQPALTEAGQRRRAALGGFLTRPANQATDRPLQERCVTYGSPQLVAGYQSHYQIVQTAGEVVFLTEMIHDARVIPLDRRPHLPATVRQWLGDSVGHWEGDTLVVDTTNYKERSFMSVSSESLHVTERFTRTGPETLKYEITIDDPETWTKPWSVMIPLTRSRDQVFEYACHEGNLGMADILSGARAEERAARQQP